MGCILSSHPKKYNAANLTFMGPCIVNVLSITNKMQRYTILFITVNALYVSGGFSAHHQELKTVHTASGIGQACLLLPLLHNVASCWLYLNENKFASILV
jgi:hypothetical protein